jgi:hypothetical protein
MIATSKRIRRNIPVTSRSQEIDESSRDDEDRANVKNISQETG